MRSWVGVIVMLVAVVPHAGGAQRRLPPASGLLNRVDVSTDANLTEVEPGGTIVLRVEVRPHRDIRVFAPGADHFTPATLILARARGLKVGGRPEYDVPAVEKNPGNNKRVPLYTRTFHVSSTVTVDKRVKPGTDIKVTGLLTYQACDDRIVFPKRSLPVGWTIHVRNPGRDTP
jgi:hypothetical protein